MEELLQFIELNRGNKHISKYEEFKEIISLTSFLNPLYEVSSAQRTWHIKNLVFEPQLCEICHSPLPYDKKHGKYLKTCSKECLQKLYTSGKFSEIVIRNQEKTRLTNLKKYGVENFSKTKEFREKFRETNIKKYGVNNFTKTKEYVEKTKRTNLSIYGVLWYSQSEEYKNNIQKTQKERYKTNIKKYGTKHYALSAKAQELFISKAQKELSDLTILQYVAKHKYVAKCDICGNVFQFNSVSSSTFRKRKKGATFCPVCNPISYKSYSIAEKEILVFIKSLYKGKILENDHAIIQPYELDIFLPELSLAIEYNGDYWHANPTFYKESDFIKGKLVKEIWKKDKSKKELCEKKGIRLITIWELDWIHKKESIKNNLSKTISLISK